MKIRQRHYEEQELNTCRNIRSPAVERCMAGAGGQFAVNPVRSKTVARTAQ